MHRYTPNTPAFVDLTPADVERRKGAVRLIDVRQPHEYVGELGHIPGAELVPLGELQQAAAGWDKQQELVVVCRSGGRSGQGAGLLAQLGFARVHNMVGGMLRWNAEGRAVAR